jgi:hypothetical protein
MVASWTDDTWVKMCWEQHQGILLAKSAETTSQQPELVDYLIKVYEDAGCTRLQMIGSSQ